MDEKLWKRIMQAKKYQMMAVRSLFPEEKQEHITTIEREMKALIKESILDGIQNFAFEKRENNFNAAAAPCPEEEKKDKKKGHKVTIA